MLTAALGHYSNVPIQIKWMQRLLQQLFATQHLAFNNSILGPSGTFLHTCTWDIQPPPHLQGSPESGGGTRASFVVVVVVVCDGETDIQIREPQAKTRVALKWP